MKLSFAFALVAALPLAAQTPAPAPTKPLSVVVFSDFQCPYSAHLFFTLENYQRDHPDRLHVTWKQSPLSIHPDAPLAHKAALAAARQNRFDAMAELLYANPSHQDLSSLLADARQLHLDLVRFRRDLDSTEIARQLAADTDERQAFGITETPTTYIGGKSLVGEQTPESLAAAIQSATATEAAAAAPPTVAAPPALNPQLLAALEQSPSAEQGSAAAPLTIVEFTDFQCPFCKSAVQPMEAFMAAHRREVHWVVRSFPLDFHPDSELANEAALAAGEQGQFWPMHDLLFAHQDALKPADLRRYAEQLHLDMASFDSALDTHRLAGKIAADRALGFKAGVEATPTFIVDGHPFTGAPSVAELEQLLADRKLPAAERQVVVAAVAPTEVDRRILGPEQAPLTLTWYTDVRSPLAPAQSKLIHSLSQRYGSKLRVLFKAYPLAAHPDSTLAAAALIAAQQQEAFWPMFDALSAHTAQLTRESVVALATSLKLEPTSFINALDDATAAAQQDIAAAQRRGILGAPVIFLNDKRVDGLQREAFYTNIADTELKSAPAIQAGLAATAPSAP